MTERSAHDMRSGRHSPAFLTRGQIVLLVLWVATVAPFVFLGYGSDDDTGLVYRAAHHIWETGSYWRSRSTGFPLYELAVTPLLHLGSFYLANAWSTLCGAIYLFALFHLWNRGELRSPVLVVLATAFLPVVVKNSSSMMDYMSAMAALSWSYVLLVRGRAWPGAALIGLAAGFRPSSGLFAVPASLMTWLQSRRLARGALVAVVAAAAGAAAFSPVIAKYGLANAFSGERLGTAMTLKQRLVLAAFYGSQLYGVLGTAALAALLAWAIFRRQPAGDAADRARRAFHLTNAALYVGAFTLLPAEPEYMLPATFSLALLADRLLPRRAFLALTVVLLSYHVVQLETMTGESGHRRLHLALGPGYTIRDAQDRVFKMSLRAALARCHVEQPTILMYGHQWLPDFEGGWESTDTDELYKRTNTNLYVSRKILDPGKLRALRARGFRIVLWKDSVSDYLSGPAGAARRPYVEIVDRLDDLLGVPIAGRASSQ